LGGRLFLIGEVADTAPYMAGLDLFLLTSREDPFPLVMLEAARQAVPVVCFEGAGGATEFVDETVGATVPMLDVAGMTAAVKRFKASPELRRRVGDSAYERSLQYTITRMGGQTCDVLKSVMQASTRARG
jgi:glycosyltransferase involved in cell wall biosynthesis